MKTEKLLIFIILWSLILIILNYRNTHAQGQKKYTSIIVKRSNVYLSHIKNQQNNNGNTKINTKEVFKPSLSTSLFSKFINQNQFTYNRTLYHSSSLSGIQAFSLNQSSLLLANTALNTKYNIGIPSTMQFHNYMTYHPTVSSMYSPGIYSYPQQYHYDTYIPSQYIFSPYVNNYLYRSPDFWRPMPNDIGFFHAPPLYGKDQLDFQMNLALMIRDYKYFLSNALASQFIEIPTRVLAKPGLAIIEKIAVKKIPDWVYMKRWEILTAKYYRNYHWSYP